MSGIHRFSDGTVQVHTTLQANGWVCTHNQLPYRAVYERGREVIELESDCSAFYSLGDRRVSNGTYESIVERYAVDLDAVAALSRAQLGAVIDRLGELDEGHALTGEDVRQINNAIVTLKQHRDTLEG